MSRRGGAKTTRMCAHCGKSFMAYLVELRRREVRFCSALCYNQYRRQRKLSVSEMNKRTVEQRYRVKVAALAYYSGGAPKCARCGITDIDVLCLDHIEGGGTKDRKDTRHWGAKLHYYLRRHAYPSGYQVLCANCNMKKFIVEGK